MTKTLLLIIMILSTAVAELENLSISSSLKTAKYLEKNGDINGSISIYMNILEKNPNHRTTIQKLKAIFLNHQLYNDGIKFLNKRMNNNPNNQKVYAELGEFYFLNEQISEAHKTWNNAQKKFINDRSFYRTMVSIYGKYGLDKKLDLLLLEGRKRFGLSFLSYESGVYYQAIKVYDKAMDQFLLNLIHNSRQIGIIERRILIMSDDEESLSIIENKLLNASDKHPDKTLNVLSEFYFKQQKYQKALKAKKDWYSNKKGDPQEWLKFANDFREEGQFQLAIDSYNYIMSFNLNPYFKGRILLGLAQTFEDQIIPSNKKNIIPYFFEKNIFFEDPFQVYSTISNDHLSKSISLYDSMLVSMNKSALKAEAYFKLGELQYRILQDFDQAYTLFNKSLKNQPSEALKTKIILRIVDVLIARGQLEEAEGFIKRQIKINPSKQLELKNVFISFLMHSPDSTLQLIESLISNINPIDPAFNDIIELKNIINEYFSENDKNIFIYYQKSEYYLRQKKIGDAIQELNFIKNEFNNTKIVPLINLRLAILYYRLKDFDNALKFIEPLENTKLADKGIILAGQIHEMDLLNIEKAVGLYMRILDEYPSSIFAEPIRYHIRKIQKVKNS